MKYEVTLTKRFVKAYKNCKKSGFDMKRVDDWMEIIIRFIRQDIKI